MANVNKLLEVALAEVGYQEKASNRNLDSHTANAGYGNWTKYARDLDAIPGFYNTPKNGYPWCDIFVDWCLVKAFGVEKAKSMINHSTLGAGCVYSARDYRNIGRWGTEPKVGAQIFFGPKGDEYHTGIVKSFDNTYVYTIEGNTSPKDGVIDNGGGTYDKFYKLNYYEITGYGYPLYDDEIEPEPIPTPKPTPETPYMDTVEKIQSWAGTDVDGIYGPNTHDAIVCKAQAAAGTYVDGIFGPDSTEAWGIVRYNESSEKVRAMQAMLICRGYSCGIYGADGDFGADTLIAVKGFQHDYKLDPDGEVGPLTANELF